MTRYFGDAKFYKKVLLVAVPIMIQTGITNFVNMLDNVMVGQLGSDAISGVAIVNQLVFVYNLCAFGALAGIGIFSAQFYGKGDVDGMRYTFRMQVIVGMLVAAIGISVFLLGGGSLIRHFLTEDGGGGSVAQTFSYARQYLFVILFELLPFAWVQVYAGMLRSTNETVVPMVAGLVAVGVNLSGNYLLIYGKLGAPRLGVTGAALATALSRIVELLIVVLWTHRHPKRNPYITGAYRRLFSIPGSLLKRVAVKAWPLLLNETLWSAGQTMLVQCYSVRGLSAVTALNISNTIANVFNISFIAMGNAIAIILGQILGKNEIERAKAEARRLTVFSLLLCFGFGVLMYLVSGVFPRIYQTSDEIRLLATGLIRIGAVCMIMYSYENSTYFTLRSGGKTFVTFLFDCGFVWVVSVPFAFLLSRGTHLPVLTMYALVQSVELLKCLIGFLMVRQGSWAKNLTVE